MGWGSRGAQWWQTNPLGWYLYEPLGRDTRSISSRC
jgi:hypothetical protein